MASTAEPPSQTEAPEPEIPRVTLMTRLRQELKEQKGNDPVTIPRDLLELILGWLFRWPDQKEKTVTRPFGAKHRALIRKALANMEADILKTAKKLEEDLGYQGLADAMKADAGAIESKILPEFNEQAELPLVDAKPPELPLSDGQPPAKP